MLVLAMMELVAHDMHDPNNEASVKDGKERGKGQKNLWSGSYKVLIPSYTV
jgi:hypothetical protein